ncbi:16S rRNA (adenine(1518)-N(6)/adenine(1519)-N(6))-dimethyltransferase RsmA [Synechococcus sp. RSCCF101]|uniref:16S rRNA (adenine(1518)-N(6)/adenine(1519)-N(6))- dimethyltransferase RsmA n=1 Tax=Synechococcus sp. RSCCF101 TaxID=2511069 RepID=UPI001246D6AD|nr:16S rRNA (adenine(1518)-N(6)/adenine(1519)-N(6))-dimethyltransferase RsmA [Synechococcus sp. RSCCF101]QEY31580.1 16S rRNA (adenine(1518)-N(6)/adenine(1519)-N(6))-dimethyltransferase RsmA [Synechococcus sp. RSCCF101]
MSFSGHRARKRFGQHWLTDAGVLRSIVTAGDLGRADRVLEIGPGRGALTDRLLEAGVAEVRAIELDRDLAAGLRQRYRDEPRFRLIEGDVLRVPLRPEGEEAATKVVANIPYNITGPLLERLVGPLNRPLEPPFQRLVLLLQREVAERLHAAPGSPAYSGLSVRMQLLMRCRSVCNVPPRCFRPPPRVHSQVVLLEPRPPEERPAAPLAGAAERLLRAAFASRRKMLRNTLPAAVPDDALLRCASEASVDLSQRPQDLAPERWLALAQAVLDSGPSTPQHVDG